MLCHLAECVMGWSTMFEANTVECLVRMLKEGSGGVLAAMVENCVTTLHSLSHRSM